MKKHKLFQRNREMETEQEKSTIQNTKTETPAEVRQLNPVAISGKIEDAHSERVGLF